MKPDDRSVGVKPRLKVSVKSKTFVLDTNVLLHDPQSLFRFEDNNIAIPVEVLEELDRIRSEKNSAQSGNAARVHRILSEILPDSRSMHEGVKLDNGGTLSVIINPWLADPAMRDAPAMIAFRAILPDLAKKDNRIIAAALYVKSCYPPPTILVTKDVNVALKARAVGLEAEDYTKEDTPLLESQIIAHSSGVTEDAGAVKRATEQHWHNGSTAIEDQLNRRKLAQIIADFLRDPRTKAPLTLSIEGTWGSGKSTFMQILSKELEHHGERPLKTFFFNPWRLQSHEELWAVFALEILDKARAKIPWFERVKADLKLSWLCLDKKRFWISAILVFTKVAGFTAAVVFIGTLMEAGWSIEKTSVLMGTGRFWGDVIGIPITLGAPIAAIVHVSMWLWRGFGGQLKQDLSVHVKRPNYIDNIGLLGSFHRDFTQALSIYAGGKRTVRDGEIYYADCQPFVVFIDDLDRCDVPRAAELMHGINLMLGDRAPLIYVLGMDRAKVAAGIAVKNQDLLSFLYAREVSPVIGEIDTSHLRLRGLEYGYEFIEKFIQLPFRLPPNGATDLRNLVRSLLVVPASEEKNTSPIKSEAAIPGASPTTSEPAVINSAPPKTPSSSDGDETHLEEPLLHAAQSLGGNPRRIAQLVNLVRLQARLAPHLGVKVSDGQLAKWTAVALRWPIFIMELEKEPDLLAQLVKSPVQEYTSPRYHYWKDQLSLVQYLRDRGPSHAKADDYDLTKQSTVMSLLRLGVAVPVAETSQTTIVADKLKPKLGDLVKSPPEGSPY